VGWQIDLSPLHLLIVSDELVRERLLPEGVAVRRLVAPPSGQWRHDAGRHARTFNGDSDTAIDCVRIRRVDRQLRR